MFRKSSKDKKIQKINEFLKVLPESQLDQVLEALVYGRVSAVEKTKLVESTTETKIVESDKVTETATEKIQEATKPKALQKSPKALQKSVTLFISKDDTRKNRLAILNAYKKYQVSVSIVASKGKDNFVRPTEKANSDKFNEVTKTLEQKLNNYGVRITGFERIYNQGGKTL
jgi:hypothetical protein